MQFFFMLSGYLYGLFPPALIDYPTFIRKKAKRLLIPYFSISALFLSIKLAGGLLFKLQFPVNLPSILAIFISPLDSFLPLLWFIYTIFIIFAIFPFLCSIVKNNIFLLFVTSLLLYYFGIRTREFCLVQFFHNLPAFTIGYIISYQRVNFDDIKPINVWVNLIAWTILFSFLFVYKELHSLANLSIDLFLYISGSFACLALSILVYLAHAKISEYLTIVGIYSMSIYLLHTMFASMVRISFYQILRLPQTRFLFGASIAVFLGVMLPLLIEKYVLRRYTLTKRLFLGLD
jgi:exopolysaccharide production protein ExoZ